MKYLERHVEVLLTRYARLFKVIMIAGARQVGKSTLLQHFLPGVTCVTFDPIQDPYGARTDPDRFLDTFGSPLLLDEVQYAPELLPAIKRRVDGSDRKGQYYLCGSQNLAVLRTVSESLAGRVGILRLDGMTLAEQHGQAQVKSWLGQYLHDPAQFVNQPRQDRSLISSSVPLTTMLWRGQLPGLLEFENNADVPAYFSSYVQTYIERDVRVMGNVSDLALFGRFLRLCGAMTAREINQSQFGRDIGVSPKTARHWLDLLVHSYQWTELPAYSGNTIKRLSMKPKGHIQDSGLACYLQTLSSPESLLASPLLGQIYESWCVGWLRSQLARLPISPGLWHWRTENGAEVDAVLEQDGKLYPIEFKASTQVSGHDTRGIQAFRTTYPQAQPGVILFAGHEAWSISPHAAAIPWNAI
ncbi:MAG TPA: GTP-binding protein [Verrucomicrobia bacterium]|nr:GTP-binding protein [Verrucomicrobiota bacterium]